MIFSWLKSALENFRRNCQEYDREREAWLQEQRNQFNTYIDETKRYTIDEHGLPPSESRNKAVKSIMANAQPKPDELET